MPTGLLVKLSTEEKTKIKEYCREHGLVMSFWARRLMLDAVAREARLYEAVKDASKESGA